MPIPTPIPDAHKGMRVLIHKSCEDCTTSSPSINSKQTLDCPVEDPSVQRCVDNSMFGLFECIVGEIVVKSPQNPHHTPEDRREVSNSL